MTTNQLEKAAAQANRLHEECGDAAKTAVIKAVELGQFLLAVQEKLAAHGPGGSFGTWVQKLSFSERTTYRYIKVAENYLGKEQMLTQGAQLIDIYRELGLIEPREGGGHRSPNSVAKGGNRYNQLTFIFDVFATQAEIFANKDTDRLKLPKDPKQIVRLKEQLTAALARVDELLAEVNAIDAGGAQ